MSFLRLSILACSLVLCSEAMNTYLAGDFEDIDNDTQMPLFREKRDSAKDPTISRYHIGSTITARFASTVVLVTVDNEEDFPQEVRFGFLFNPNAFISGFMMTVDGVSYKARVQEKEAAQRAYNRARQRGQSAAQVRQKEETSSRFFVDLNLAAQTSVVFNLTYQELLRRDKGLFTHRINAFPGQVVDDFRIEVLIIEPQGLELVESSWEPTDNRLTPLVSFLPPAVSASVVLTPSRAEQSRASRVRGLNGILQVRYDVHHALDGGDLQVVNGYFVHHISPEGLPPAPKKVIFVIDVSGSMFGRKIAQTKNAMVEILDQLRKIDSFNILTFSYGVRLWKQSAIKANKTNKIMAQDFVRTLRPYGGTNLHSPLMSAASQFRNTDDAFPAIVFLTDGRPNIGLTGTDAIVSSVKERLGDRVALFCIGFGNDVDDLLLSKLASENQGLYRKVFVDSSASLQMQNFFDEVATPLLFNIAIRYLDGAVDTDTLTDNNFISYFDGKELVVAGKVADDYQGNSIVAVVEGRGRNDISLRVSKDLDQVIDPNMVNDFCQRMWAFLTIKDYLAREKLSTSPEEKAELKQKALELSLKYSFVTPLTSLLIIRPEDIVPTTQAPPTTTALPLPLQLTPSSSAGRRPSTSSQTFRMSASRVGADPHFIIDIPHENITICFDLHANNGTYINLISDPVLDIYVNAEVIPVETSLSTESPLLSNGSPPSLIGSIGFQLGHYKILITPDYALIDFEIKMPWVTPKTLIIGEYNLTIHDKHNMTITVGDSIYMSVLRHNHWQNHPTFFDFTLMTADGFSNEVHGLVGQFQYKPMFLKNPYRQMTANGHVQGVMEVQGRDEFVYNMKETVITTSECWWSKPEVYIDGEIPAYFVLGYFSQLEAIPS